MSKKFFLNEDIEILSKNKYVKKVNEKWFTYTDEFKKLFIAENKKGRFLRDIFAECGFDINVIGLKGIQSSSIRWHSVFRKNGVDQLQNTRKYNTGRPTAKELPLEEKYENLQVQLKLRLLQAENELFKNYKC